MAKVGIPRALFYYDYFPLWQAFFEALGHQVMVSDATNKGILEDGIKRAVDETCLPVKLYMGHVQNLRDRVDYLFIPRLVSLEEKHFSCPKFIGLPDMVRGCVPNLPPILDVLVDLTDNKKLTRSSLLELGKLLGASPAQVGGAYQAGLQAHRSYRARLKQGWSHEEGIRGSRPETLAEPENLLRVALLSHPYNICDSWASNNLMGKLKRMGAAVTTADALSLGYLRQKANTLSEQIYWTFEKKLAGAAMHYLETREVDGIILVMAFECGPDSLVTELIEREVRDKLPVMTLCMDEHTGEAGIMTRLEAFVDMIVRQKSRQEAAAAKEWAEA